jgi:1,4-alpha-glucan branching enzyme
VAEYPVKCEDASRHTLSPIEAFIERFPGSGFQHERSAYMKKTKSASTRKVIFSFHPLHAGEVFVAGTFNNWEPRKDKLKKNAKGWKAVKFLEPGTYEYRFIVDGIWVDDPGCTSRRPNQYGGENCILEVF